MAKLAHQWLPIFRAGDYGEKGKYTERDLDQIVDNFDAKFHEPPVCIGHPENDKPAFGFVEQVKREGNELFAKLKDSVNPKFETAVQDGRFPKRSISLYRDKAKGFALRHLGFLGAMPPEVKGLADPVFHDDMHDAVVNIEFNEEKTVAAEADNKGIVDSIKALFAEYFPKKQNAENGGAQFDAAKFSEEIAAKIDVAVKPLKDENEKLRTQFSERESAMTTASQKAAADGAVARLEGQGKWLPAFTKMGGRQVFEELAKAGTVIEFGEGDSKKKVTPLEAMVTFMEGMAKIVPTGEHFKGATFSEASGRKYPANADPNSIKLNDLAVKHAKENKVSFGEALTAVSIEHPELTRPGGSSSGAV